MRRDGEHGARARQRLAETLQKFPRRTGIERQCRGAVGNEDRGVHGHFDVGCAAQPIKLRP
jgi:hypothetical protein